MAEAQTSSKPGLTRGKAILIGVLSVVLVAVLYIQFGGKAEKPASEATGLSTAAAGGGRATGELDGEARDAGVCEDADECTSE